MQLIKRNYLVTVLVLRHLGQTLKQALPVGGTKASRAAGSFLDVDFCFCPWIESLLKLKSWFARRVCLDSNRAEWFVTQVF